MANKLIIIWLLWALSLFALQGCKYNLDVTGVVHIDENVNERYAQSMNWNESHPPLVKATFDTEYTVVFGGDSHVGGIDNMQSLIKYADSTLSVALVIAGDACTGKNEDYRRLSETLDGVSNSLVCLVPGNHDLYFEGWNSYYELFGSATYKMEVFSAGQQDLYIFLDSGSGTLGRLQLDWLKNLLETKRNDYRYCIVTTHLNFFRNRMTGSTNPLNEELLVLLDLFEKHKVDLLISGHDHDRYIEEFGHTSYITLDAMIDGIPQASFLELKVSDTGLYYEFIAF